MPDNAGILSFVSAIAGVLFGLVALVLLAKQRFVKGESAGSVEVELPVFGRIKSNYPALVVVFIGAFLIVYPQSRQSAVASNSCPPPQPSPPIAQVTVKGKLQIEQASQPGIMVGIIPGSLTPTDSEGEYSMSVNRVPGSYTAVAFVPASRFAPVLKMLTFTNDTAVFNYDFTLRGPHGAEGAPPGEVQ